MDRTTSGPDRCSIESPAPRADRLPLLNEITSFVQKYGDILARYHRYSMDDLDHIEEECMRLHGEACGRGACGSAGELLELEYLIGRAKEMKAKREG
ncbi:MAG: hypothetical protein GX216_02880 [Methanomicrobiales archaeon]|nr:hypothetical protein [Methanomicrobiales archaeon]